MTTHRLFLESGPRRRKTLVHVLDLLGCVAPGPTTEAAIEATPDAIRAYLGFLRRIGESVDMTAPVETEVVEHVTEGIWLGNGSPYATFGPDREPVTADEIERLVPRFVALHAALADWVDGQPAAALDADPAAGGRPGGAVVRHVLAPVGGYLSAAIGATSAINAAAQAAERGETSLGEALRRQASAAADRIRATTEEERSRLVERPKGDDRTLRKALRRILEHDWEHLAELSRRPGGPTI